MNNRYELACDDLLLAVSWNDVVPPLGEDSVSPGMSSRPESIKSEFIGISDTALLCLTHTTTTTTTTITTTTTPATTMSKCYWHPCPVRRPSTSRSTSHRIHLCPVRVLSESHPGSSHQRPIAVLRIVVVVIVIVMLHHAIKLPSRAARKRCMKLMRACEGCLTGDMKHMVRKCGKNEQDTAF
jgi:hypothetical protein